MRLEIAVPITNGPYESYLDVVPLSSSATWGNGVIHDLAPTAVPTARSSQTSDQAGNIVAADFNGAGK